MLSVFHTLDCRHNQSSTFWQSITSSPSEDLVANTVFGGELAISHEKLTFKFYYFILTQTSIYILSKWKIPKRKANINWKRLEPFTELGTTNRFGFRIQGCNFQDFYTRTLQELDQWIDHLSHVCILQSFEEDFILIKLLNQNSDFVISLYLSSQSFLEYAVKSVDKCCFQERPYLLLSIIAEVSILRKIEHPGVVKLYYVYETETTVFIILEYLKSGDLQTRITKEKKFTEEETLKFIRVFLTTLKHLHKQNIVHRDIKPENIVFNSATISDFKLIDFGLACCDEGHLSQKCGTLGFIAPEVLQGLPYNTKADIFSLGVIMYNMLTGKPLIVAKNSNDLQLKNMRFEFKPSKLDLKGISKKTVSLLAALLNSNPRLRVSAGEALNIQDSNFKPSEFLYEKTNTTDSSNFPLPSNIVQSRNKYFA